MDTSVVIPSYRSRQFVGRAIASVLESGVEADNVIIVEDGVADDTARVVAGFSGVRLISLAQNGGAPRARNIGLSHVRTPHVMFLDADDWVEAGLLQGLEAAIAESGADIAIGPWCYDGEDRERGRVRRPPVAQSSAHWAMQWINGQFFPPCCVLWKTDGVRAIGGWDERLKKDQDGELIIRALIHGLSIQSSDAGLGVYWQHTSPGRLTRGASVEHIMASAEIVYAQVARWLSEDDRASAHGLSLGRHCCKMAWVAMSYGDQERARAWRDRATAHGYLDKGYDPRTRLLAAVLGVRLSARLKALLRGDARYLKAVAQR